LSLRGNEQAMSGAYCECQAEAPEVMMKGVMM